MLLQNLYFAYNVFLSLSLSVCIILIVVLVLYAWTVYKLQNAWHMADHLIGTNQYKVVCGPRGQPLLRPLGYLDHTVQKLQFVLEAGDIDT